MPRKLGDGDQILQVRDPVGGALLTLYYRVPTSEERLAYQSSVFRLEGGRREFHLAETRLKFGLEILTGFAPGDFTFSREGREECLDPKAHSDWKEYLTRYAPDLVSFLGQHVFEGLRAVGQGRTALGE